jgi:cell division protein FtsB
MRNRRREEVETKKRRRRTVLLTCGTLIVIYLFFTAIFGENGFVRYLKMRSFRTDIQAEIKNIKKQNEEIKKQIDIFKDKKDLTSIEDLAREQGLTKEDELTFKFEEGQ